MFSMRVELMSARQDVWDLTGHVSTSPVLLPEGAAESLVGVASSSFTFLPGAAVSAEVPFFLHDMRGERDLVDVVHSFWSGWNVFRPWPQPVPCRLAQESLDAVGFSQADPDGTQWVDDPYHVVEVPELDNSPEISLEARDGMLWETVSAQARNSGLILGARLWWPGDDPVRSWSLARSGMQPRDLDISPSQGESRRRIVYNTFDHAMVVLEVKEVARS